MHKAYLTNERTQNIPKIFLGLITKGCCGPKGLKDDFIVETKNAPIGQIIKVF